MPGCVSCTLGSLTCGGDGLDTESDDYGVNAIVVTENGASYPTTPDENNVVVSTDIIVKGRNILQELDEIKHHMLLLPRDQKLEEKYPELKEAYDAYLELYRGVQIARKMMEVNE